ncbi:MAG: hypothetical protein H7Y20_10230 [Bryobacteraceae bacterium]|nr:hypothetical protein [Bryobacteraceae bacterium]
MKRLIAGLLLALSAAAAPRWEMQYFLDEKDTTLILTDIAFPSAQRGLAVGGLAKNGRVKPVAMVTSDGGAKWTQVNAPDTGHSLFCLDETSCWMVSDKGIYFTDETGRTWKKIKGEEGLTGVYFLTREQGWAFGAGRKVIATKDGGKSWTRVSEAEKLGTSKERTVFHAMVFLDAKTGFLTGRSEPLIRAELPVWMETEPELRKERPALSVFFETKNSGQTWTTSTASIFGRIARMSSAAGTGVVLSLFEFDHAFSHPSEIWKLDAKSGKQSRLLRMKDFAATDVAVSGKSTAIVAGFEPAGAIAKSPIPGRIRVFESSNLDTWSEMNVDYRAGGHRVRIAAADSDHVWIATDTGMILRLVR